jgi:pimeloyl-ACP methyl ester carboxylesterase
MPKLLMLFAGCALLLDAQGRTASVNDISMYYETYGEGEPLILLHGFSSSGATWKPVIPELSKQYRLIVPDLRGHGRSTNPTNKFTHRQSALDIYALLDQLGIKQFKAMGISTGGMTLIHMATQQPARVDAMVLIGATIYFPEQAREIMRKSTPESLNEQGWARMRQTHKLGDEQIRALRAEFYAFKDSYDDMNFTPPYLATITARTLIVHGDRDQFFPVEIPVQMYRSIPRSYLWLVPNGGHVPIFDHLAEFNQVTGAFLKAN